MPFLDLRDGACLHYVLDDFTAPWGKAETVLLVHGNSEDSRAWFGWVPHLARDYRILRPDWRGYGQSTPMPVGYQWSLDTIADDFAQLLDAQNIARCHVVGAKIGGALSVRFAARHPQRVSTLTMIGAPVSGKQFAGQADPSDEFERQGPQAYYRRTMGGRLGRDVPPDATDYWIDYMSAAPRSTLVGFVRALKTLDVTADLPHIKCPTLVVIGDSGGIIDSVESVSAWQRTIPNSELMVIPSDSYHIALTKADEAAPAVHAFMRRHGNANGGSE
jgi:pimeloyl-ACP methyl ester carboxylesterase